MKSLASCSLAVAAALYGSTALADPILIQAHNDVQFRIAVPESSAGRGSGNIYFQMTAPDSYEWVALGTGSGMVNSNIFLMYQDGNGNITLSPRAGTSRSMPRVDTDGADLELLAGSGVANGRMTANVRCGNCESWGSGSMSFDSDNSDWIAAWREGDPIDTTDVNHRIDYHDGRNVMGVDLTQAVIADDSNPFAGDGADTDSNNGSVGDDSGSGSGSGSNNGVTLGGSSGVSSNVLLAHGLILSIVFIGMYPIGSMLMPLLGKWMIHAGWQSVAFLAMWAGFGLGVVYARDDGKLFTQPHTIFGTVLIALFTVQPILGVAQHMHYRKHQTRGAFGHSHIWFGRVLMVLAIINGGLGLRLANSSNAYIIAYSIIAAAMGVLYGFAVLFKSSRRRASGPRPETRDTLDSRYTTTGDTSARNSQQEQQEK